MSLHYNDYMTILLLFLLEALFLVLFPVLLLPVLALSCHTLLLFCVVALRSFHLFNSAIYTPVTSFLGRVFGRPVRPQCRDFFAIRLLRFLIPSRRRSAAN